MGDKPKAFMACVNNAEAAIAASRDAIKLGQHEDARRYLWAAFCALGEAHFAYVNSTRPKPDKSPAGRAMSAPTTGEFRRAVARAKKGAARR